VGHEHRCPGNITGNIGDEPDIADALQILRLVIELSNIIDGNTSEFCPAIWRAALIDTSTCLHIDCDCTPDIADALQILRFVISLSSVLEDIWRKTT
jgi:hypothetical protein